MIVDAVLANDEWDLVKFRLQYLAPAVSKLYIGESGVTFSGIKKELFFKSRCPQLVALGFEVEVIVLSIPKKIMDEGDRWAIETHSRDQFLERVSALHPYDIILFSDVDEIPSREQVENVKSREPVLRVQSIPTQVFLRKANWLEYEPKKWKGKWGNALLGRYRVPRIRRGLYPLVAGEPGAHFSYVGMDAAQIRRKYHAFSHAELDRDELSSLEVLSFANEFHISHLGRAFDSGAGLLRVVKEEDLTSVQRKAFALFPEWFDFSPVRYGWHRRVVASWLLFAEVRGWRVGSFEDAKAPLISWVWLRHTISFAVIWVARKFAIALRLDRLAQKLVSGLR